ncbi:xanthine dehydrogenase YagS FAD-binding subunit [Williamsia limnetica]|uniref:Xanthine dehydrogenase YagS FAD-binding subunit n=1 Tax=Williamsia limnetica TaxID=882452 RepID=A0A318RT37_WILLI|nr:xanthine dehydrogenase family protein subunit M [Williamsia limnetica]PYE20881.1 xanthine dehydrogenase YagS FAD-binding subunit [Williamsia limnetica]
MKTFDYVAPDSVDTAVERLGADPDSTILAGGTNLVDLMKLGVCTPDTLIDIGALPLDQVQLAESGELQIGANVRNSDLAANPVVRTRYPVLSQALLAGASGQLRNMATTGGNLFQRTRCPYFMDTGKACNKREPGSGCSAVTGVNRDMAILGASPQCVATHPSDMAVALAVLEPQLEVLGPAGQRFVPFDALYRLPGDHPELDTILERDDLVVSVTVPQLPAARSSTYRKVRDRASFAFALVSVAAVLEVQNGAVSAVRIALGGVAHKPWRARAAEERLIGRTANRSEFAAAIDLELQTAQALSDNGFKIPMVRSLVTQTLVELADDEEAKR